MHGPHHVGTEPHRLGRRLLAVGDEQTPSWENARIRRSNGAPLRGRKIILGATEALASAGGAGVFFNDTEHSMARVADLPSGPADHISSVHDGIPRSGRRSNHPGSPASRSFWALFRVGENALARPQE
jgi:hypothetical protein